jgi:hypothetical protein
MKMKIHACIQGTEDWLKLRAAYPTASELGNLVTPAKLQVCAGKAIDSYVAQKLAEKWLGHPLQSFGGGMLEQGNLRETEAWPWYAMQYDCELDTPRIGFVTDDVATVGCSPDATMVSQQVGLEIKCPAADTHIAWLLAGVLPREHLLQVQGSMLVTGWPEWTFLSYHPSLPKLVIPVKRDETVCKALADAIGVFWEKFTDGWARLVEVNDGELPEHMTTTKKVSEVIWQK